MTTNMKRAGGWLLIVAVAAIVIGMILWSRATDQAHTAELGNLLAGRATTHPNHGPATVWLILGAISALTGIVLLGASSRSEREPVDSGSTTRS